MFIGATWVDKKSSKRSAANEGGSVGKICRRWGPCRVDTFERVNPQRNAGS
jgi:hypothetical protein